MSSWDCVSAIMESIYSLPCQPIPVWNHPESKNASFLTFKWILWISVKWTSGCLRNCWMRSLKMEQSWQLCKIPFREDKSSPSLSIRKHAEARNWHSWTSICWAKWRKESKEMYRQRKQEVCSLGAGTLSGCAERGSGKILQVHWSDKKGQGECTSSDQWEERPGFNRHGEVWGTQQVLCLSLHWQSDFLLVLLTSLNL